MMDACLHEPQRARPCSLLACMAGVWRGLQLLRQCSGLPLPTAVRVAGTLPA